MRRLVIGGLLALQLFVAGAVLLPSDASASQPRYCSATGSTFLGLPTWYAYLDFDSAHDCKINFSVTDPKDFSRVALAVFQILLRIGGIVAVVYTIYGGFQYLIARGEADRAKSARTTIMNALIGLVITLFAAAIVNLIARQI